jgi:hypothetical protein
MSIFTTIKGYFVTTEQDVIKLVTAVSQDLPVLEKDINNAFSWIANETPTIAANLQTATTLVTAVGAASNPQVAAAITAANLAVQGLNAFAAQYNAGAPSATAVIDGYIALKQASAAASSAAAAAAASSVSSPAVVKFYG